MQVNYHFDAAVEREPYRTMRLEAAVLWSEEPVRVYFLVRPYQSARVEAEWKVPAEGAGPAAAFLAGVAADGIPQPLSDWLQENDAPAWVWKGVVNEPDWAETVPWRGATGIGYTNVGGGPSMELTLTPEQRAEIGRRLIGVRERGRVTYRPPAAAEGTGEGG